MISIAPAPAATAPGQTGKGASAAGGDLFALSMQAIAPDADMASIGGDAPAPTEPARQALAVPGIALPTAATAAAIDPALAWLPAVNIAIPAPLDIPPALAPIPAPVAKAKVEAPVAMPGTPATATPVATVSPRQRLLQPTRPTGASPVALVASPAPAVFDAVTGRMPMRPMNVGQPAIAVPIADADADAVHEPVVAGSTTTETVAPKADVAALLPTGTVAPVVTAMPDAKGPVVTTPVAQPRTEVEPVAETGTDADMAAPVSETAPSPKHDERAPTIGIRTPPADTGPDDAVERPLRPTTSGPRVAPAPMPPSDRVQGAVDTAPAAVIDTASNATPVTPPPSGTDARIAVAVTPAPVATPAATQAAGVPLPADADAPSQPAPARPAFPAAAADTVTVEPGAYRRPAIRQETASPVADTDPIPAPPAVAVRPVIVATQQTLTTVPHGQRETERPSPDASDPGLDPEPARPIAVARVAVERAAVAPPAPDAVAVDRPVPAVVPFAAAPLPEVAPGSPMPVGRRPSAEAQRPLDRPAIPADAPPIAVEQTALPAAPARPVAGTDPRPDAMTEAARAQPVVDPVDAPAGITIASQDKGDAPVQRRLALPVESQRDVVPDSVPVTDADADKTAGDDSASLDRTADDTVAASPEVAVSPAPVVLPPVVLPPVVPPQSIASALPAERATTLPRQDTADRAPVVAAAKPRAARLGDHGAPTPIDAAVVTHGPATSGQPTLPAEVPAARSDQPTAPFDVPAGRDAPRQGRQEDAAAPMSGANEAAPTDAPARAPSPDRPAPVIAASAAVPVDAAVIAADMSTLRPAIAVPVSVSTVGATAPREPADGNVPSPVADTRPVAARRTVRSAPLPASVAPDDRAASASDPATPTNAGPATVADTTPAAARRTVGSAPPAASIAAADETASASTPAATTNTGPANTDTAPVAAPKPTFIREVAGTARQTVALRPQATAPAQPVAAGTRASAGQVFGAAIQAANDLDERRRTPAMPPVATPAAAVSDVRATTTVATPMQAPLDMRRGDWPNAMIDRIERLRDAADANDTRIRLVPDALGGIDVSVKTVGDALHVRFAADDATTRALIEDARPRLAALAEERGIRLAQTLVEAPAPTQNASNQNAQSGQQGAQMPASQTQQQAQTQGQAGSGQSPSGQSQSGQSAQQGNPQQQRPSASPSARQPSGAARGPRDTDAAGDGRIA